MDDYRCFNNFCDGFCFRKIIIYVLCRNASFHFNYFSICGCYWFIKSKDEIKNNGGNIEEIFREADIWFPSQLPDGKFVDLVKLQDKDDQTYVNTLLRTLREEMRASDAKLASVVDLVWEIGRAHV